MDDRIRELTKKYSKVVAKAWSDDSFKQRLMANPLETLKNEGFDVAPGTQITLVEGTAKAEFSAGRLVLPIPAKPSAGELTDAQLEQIGGGLLEWATPSMAPGVALGPSVTMSPAVDPASLSLRRK